MVSIHLATNHLVLRTESTQQVLAISSLRLSMVMESNRQIILSNNPQLTKHLLAGVTDNYRLLIGQNLECIRRSTQLKAQSTATRH